MSAGCCCESASQMVTCGRSFRPVSCGGAAPVVDGSPSAASGAHLVVLTPASSRLCWMANLGAVGESSRVVASRWPPSTPARGASERGDLAAACEARGRRPGAGRGHVDQTAPSCQLPGARWGPGGGGSEGGLGVSLVELELLAGGSLPGEGSAAGTCLSPTAPARHSH